MGAGLSSDRGVCLPCSSSEAAFLPLGVDYKCKDKRYETAQSPESLGFPE